eukprot:3941059-Rhodomonas_salina.2
MPAVSRSKGVLLRPHDEVGVSGRSSGASDFDHDDDDDDDGGGGGGGGGYDDDVLPATSQHRE